MFHIGDLVVLKNSGVVSSRYHPSKKVGIVIDVQRNVFNSYDGIKEDAVTVKWMPLDLTEILMEFYLQHLED